uniref:BRCT domain-containing protein n=1 Tax=Meloidogyne javanica TaxID=6303 RepID=A0A915MQS4_MELJA
MELKSEPKMNESAKSKVFNGVTISFAGLTEESQYELIKLLLEMGGDCRLKVDENVNYLIAEIIDNKLENYIEITISGFAGTERIEIGRLIEMNGGIFIGQMFKSSCTHLITANDSGEKFCRAKEWKTIYIVTVEWLRKSIEHKFRLDELEFSYESKSEVENSPLANIKQSQNYENFEPTNKELFETEGNHFEPICQGENAPLVESQHNDEYIKNKPIESTGSFFEQIYKAENISAVGIFNNPDVVEPAQNERNETIHNDEMICHMELKAEPENNESDKSKPFSGITISFSGLTKEQQDELTKLLLEMGGNCKLEVDEDVKYLIAERCDNKSENYITARRLKIPVVIPRWIQDAHSRTDSIVDFLSEESTENYRTPIFSGCEITISGFTGNDRHEIGRLVEMNGGIFSGQMNRSSCTHLITANNSGEKFRRAKNWKNIYIVNFEWLKKSVERKVRLDEIEFSFESICKAENAPTVDMLQPTKNGPIESTGNDLEPICQVENAPTVDVLQPTKNGPIESTGNDLEPICQVENAPPVESLHTEEIFESTKNKPIESTGNDFEQIHKAVDTSTVEKLYNLKVIEPTTQNEHIEEINNDEMIHNKELEAEPKMNESVKSKAFCGVTISFTGLSRESQDELTKLLLEMGGDCRLEVDEHVNYLIAEVCDNKSENYIAARRLKIPVLIPRWVQDAHSSTNSMVDFLSEESIDNYRTPIFSGCEITISGFTSNERVGMGRLIELHGGKFSGQMNKSSCTHLITANNSGEKFRRAKEWKNIYIVNDKWLRKSIEYKVRLNELRFPVDGDK